MAVGFAQPASGSSVERRGARAERNRPDPDAVRQVLAGTRTTANAAWWGFDENNATSAVQAAIRSGARKLIVPDMGKPWVVEPIELAADQEIVFEKGVVVAARPGAFRGPGDSLLVARNKQNITLRGYGATLRMRKADYRKPPYEKAEWRHCISLRGCRNVTIQGLHLAASGGDGIYVGRGVGADGPAWCEDVHIKDVVCDDHYRQGISVITARNLLIEGCVLRKTEGTAPQAGIDFEPNQADEKLINCVLRDCVIERNAGPGVLMYFGHLRSETGPISILVERCKIRENGGAALAIHGSKRSQGLRGRILVRDNELDDGRRIDVWPHLTVRIE